MHNQFCKRCGQANFPNATACTKCGNPLMSASNNPFGSGGEPPPTMMGGGQQFSSPSPEHGKSKTKFFVIGAIAVVLVLFIGLIGIAGVGALVYYSNQDEVVRDDSGRDKPADDAPSDTTDSPNSSGDDNPLSDIKFPSTDDSGTSSGGDNSGGDSSGSGKVTDAQLLSFFLQEKSTVGKYQLKNVKTTDSRDNYPNRTAGATAEYEKGSTKVTHEVALYESTGSLKEDFDDYASKAKSGGGKVQTSKETSIIYIKGSLVYLAFYNPQGGFHVMSSNDGKDILEYHNAYFGVE
jgi:hypothetical protein